MGIVIGTRDSRIDPVPSASGRYNSHRTGQYTFCYNLVDSHSNIFIPYVTNKLQRKQAVLL